jgi:hypothetical protein
VQIAHTRDDQILSGFKTIAGRHSMRVASLKGNQIFEGHSGISSPQLSVMGRSSRLGFESRTDVGGTRPNMFYG